MDESAGLYEFVGFGELAETTTQLLALSLHTQTLPGQTATGSSGQGELSRVEQLVLQQARDYLATVREGFVLSVRTERLTRRGELNYLLERVLTDWSGLSRELQLDNEGSPASEADGERLRRVRHQLLAFGMAVVALGQLPRLPAKQVTFPHSYGNPPTYSDIPVPSTPGELLWRIEELEQMIWRLMSDAPAELVQRRYGPLRRTYGFFEAGAWLGRKEAERFGIKPRRATLALL
jgi:hypothetical protein